MGKNNDWEWKQDHQTKLQDHWIYFDTGPWTIRFKIDLLTPVILSVFSGNVNTFTPAIWFNPILFSGIEIDFIFNMHTVHIGFWIYMHQTNFTCTLNRSSNLLKETCQLIVMVTSKRPTATNSIVKGKYKKGNKCWSSWKWAMLKFFYYKQADSLY